MITYYECVGHMTNVGAKLEVSERV